MFLISFSPPADAKMTYGEQREAGLDLSAEMTQVDLAATTLYNMIEGVGIGNREFDSKTYNACHKKIESISQNVFLNVRDHNDISYAYGFVALGNMDFNNFISYMDIALANVLDNEEEEFYENKELAYSFYDSGMTQYDKANDYLTYLKVFEEVGEQ